MPVSGPRRYHAAQEVVVRDEIMLELEADEGPLGGALDRK